MGEPLYIIGQIFGMIAILLGFISYQMRTQRQILLLQSATAVVFCIHYGLIGAFSGMAMNGVNIVRNFFYDRRNRKAKKDWITPTVFALIQTIACLLTWEAWYSVFILVGVVTNTVCMSFSDPQAVRKSILVTSPLILTYDILARSIGGSIYESVAGISAFVGILRHQKQKNDVTK